MAPRFSLQRGIRKGHAVAAGSGAFAMAVFTYLLASEPVFAATVLGGLCAAIAYEDWRAFRVPDVFTAALLVCGVVLGFAGKPDGPISGAMIDVVADVVLCGGALWLVRIAYRATKGKDGLGLGDVKFAAAAGPWVGWPVFPWVVLAASFLAICWFLALGKRSVDRIPFAAFLSPALCLCWLAVRVV